MKIREIVERLNEKQKKTIMKCLKACGLPDLDAEVKPEVEGNILEFLKAISNPIRFKILKMTKDHWLCVCLISDILNQDQTLISHHLRTLKSLNLLEERREGRLRFYKVRREVIEEYLKKVEEELLGE